MFRLATRLSLRAQLCLHKLRSVCTSPVRVAPSEACDHVLCAKGWVWLVFHVCAILRGDCSCIWLQVGGELAPCLKDKP